MALSAVKDSEKASKSPQILAALGASIGAFSLGTAYGWTSPTLVRISGDNCGDDCYFAHPLSSEQASWVSGLLTVGALLSSLLTGCLMSKIGRKWTMVSMVVPFTLGWSLLAAAGPAGITDPWVYYAGRILTGIGGGAFALAAPIYINEISEPSVRGALGSCIWLMVSVGELFTNGVGALVEWDVLTGMFIIFPIIMATIMFFLPESPYHLITKGREEEALKSLQWLRGEHCDVESEFKAMQLTYASHLEVGTVSTREFLTKSVYLKPALIMLALMFLQQYCGMNVVMFYLTDIFEKADTGIDAGLSATLVALVQVVTTGLAVLVVDRFGRKILLLASSFLMCVSILALGVFFYLDENKQINCKDNYNSSNRNNDTLFSNFTTKCVPQEGIYEEELVSSLRWLPLASLVVYVFAMAVGLGPLPWMMNAEFFSPEAKVSEFGTRAGQK